MILKFYITFDTDIKKSSKPSTATFLGNLKFSNNESLKYYEWFVVGNTVLQAHNFH